MTEKSPAVFGITGWKNAGKTTLVVALIDILSARGLRVATVKHAHHNFDIDREGKDSWRHRKAGAAEVIVASANRWAMIHEYRGEEEAGLEALLARLSPCDLVLVEGYKRDRHDKIQVYRGQEHETLLAPEDASIVAVASDAENLATGGVPVLPLADPERIANFILERTGLG